MATFDEKSATAVVGEKNATNPLTSTPSPSPEAIGGDNTINVDDKEADLVIRRQTTHSTTTDVETAAGGETATVGDGDSPKDDANGSSLPFSKARCIALVTTVTGAAFVNTLALQSIVIILPSIGRDLSIPESRQQWVISSYTLTFGCFLLFWGRVADIYGKRLIFILGSIWVTAVTAANAFVPNEIGFNIFRALHALGAAANVPTAIGILGVTFPPGKAKNYAFSAYGAGAPLGSVFGNVLSGFIAEYSSWKWVFGALAIMAGIISVAGMLFIPHPPPSMVSQGKNDKPSIDWIGAILITVGLLALMFALTEGNVAGWSTPWIPALIVVSILIITAFVIWQWHLERRWTAAKEEQAQEEMTSGVLGGDKTATATTTASTPPSPSQPTRSSPTPPLIKISIFRNLRFSAVMLIMALFFASFNNYLIYATYYYQEFQGYSPLQTMLRFIPTGAGGAIVIFIVAQLLSRVPTLFILISGNFAISVANLLFAVPIPPTTSYFAWGLPAMLLSVVGADTTWPCLTLYTSSALPREDQAIGGALINSVGQIGRAIGLAISTAIQTAVMANARHVPVDSVGSIRPWEPESLKGLRAASWANFGFGLASLVVVLIAFRGMEIIGKPTSRPVSPSAKPVDEEAAVANDDKKTERG